ncbi:hypothetical protein Z043_123086, partial [Scleropages formosus]
MSVFLEALLFITRSKENYGNLLVDLRLGDVGTFLSFLQLVLYFPVPGQFLELFLSTLHGQTLSLIQTMLKVLDCDLQVLLHPL